MICLVGIKLIILENSKEYDELLMQLLDFAFLFTTRIDRILKIILTTYVSLIVCII